ncbi:hypothetical protein D3C85_1509690 [compost metagenome]
MNDRVDLILREQFGQQSLVSQVSFVQLASKKGFLVSGLKIINDNDFLTARQQLCYRM